MQVNTTGGAVRISQPESERGKTSPREKAEIVVDLVTPKAVGGFIGFLREHAVVGLAVGIVVGTQLKVIVDSLNANIVNELFKLVLNGDALSAKQSVVTWGANTATLRWGAVVYTIVDFLFIMVVIYAIIKFFHLEKLDKEKNK
ncbi:MAG: putative Large-conductance mechanosensitive channel-like protein [Candidatus Saccharibacteria bacterium]|nr:putative Large-conductance mechanosensitive channel-like protein [Candidatus Saccharibacteria bacterium]